MGRWTAALWMFGALSISAYARPGQSSSEWGSRGSRTFTPPAATSSSSFCNKLSTTDVPYQLTLKHDPNSRKLIRQVYRSKGKPTTTYNDLQDKVQKCVSKSGLLLSCKGGFPVNSR